ncbi:hypothetical protein ACS8E2_13680 [Psychrobacter glaciei]|uniref:hypothetical protein n=1 Tax=Psychrobacter glaciei TaxID=619771 RepID=UPI003F471B10
MDSLLVSLVVGISSSLFATALFILVSEFFRRKVLPWYGDKIYRGVRIDGDWEVCEFKGVNLKDLKDSAGFIKLSLKQSGDVIEGIYSHKGGDEETDQYVLQGRIRDMYFLATAVPKSNRHVDAITLLLYITNSKSQLIMTGGVTHKSSPGKVDCTLGVEFQWKRT